MYALVDRFFVVFIDHWRIKYLLILLIYIISSLIYAVQVPRKYEYVSPNIIESTTSDILQPLMNVLLSGKVTHFYSWRNVEKPNSDLYLDIKSTTNDRSSTNLGVKFFQSITSEFKNQKNTVTLEPDRYQGYWSLIFCDENDFCLISKLKYKGKVKIMNDGDVRLWAVKVDEMDNQSDFILLNLSQEDSETLYI
jgi:hypothetical protein